MKKPIKFMRGVFDKSPPEAPVDRASEVIGKTFPYPEGKGPDCFGQNICIDERYLGYLNTGIPPTE